MFYCEDCRLKKGWPLPVIHPFYIMHHGECDVCHREKDNYNVPKVYLIPEEKQTAVQKVLEEIEQEEFKKKAESLQIVFVYGPQRGKVHQEQTKQLREIVVMRNNVIDWRATYEVRLMAQMGHYRTEEINRDKK